MGKAKIDKDSNDYLTPNAQPEGERTTAYRTQVDIEGAPRQDDRAGNGDDVFKGSTKRLQGKRKADQNTLGTPGTMGEETKPISEVSIALIKRYTEKALNDFNPNSIGNIAAVGGQKFATDGLNGDDSKNGVDELKKSLKRSTGVKSAINKVIGLARVPATPVKEEAGGDNGATAPATSDSPSMGMYSVNANDFKKPSIELQNMLEAIALQAAETFEIVQGGTSDIPDILTTELQNCSDVVAKIYEFVSSSMTSQGADTKSGQLPPESGQSNVKEDTDELKESALALFKEKLKGLKK